MYLLMVLLPGCNATGAPASSMHVPLESPSSNKGPAPASQSPSVNINTGNDSAAIDIAIQIGNTGFAAKLYDNETTRALLALFPLDIGMDDLNHNEKFYYLENSLPANPESVGSVKAGDIMLYGPDCLVVFYESFATSYRYTRLGYITDASELAPGGETVAFRLSL